MSGFPSPPLSKQGGGQRWGEGEWLLVGGWRGAGNFLSKGSFDLVRGEGRGGGWRVAGGLGMEEQNIFGDSMSVQGKL
jgi:hypothetical protein